MSDKFNIDKISVDMLMSSMDCFWFHFLGKFVEMHMRMCVSTEQLSFCWTDFY